MIPATTDLRRGAVCATLSAGFFALLNLATPLGMASVIVSPLPIAYLAWAGPLRVAIPALLAASAALVAFMEPSAVIEYLVQFGIGGLVIGYGIKNDKPPQWMVGLFALLSLSLFSAMLITASMSQGVPLLSVMKGLSAEWMAPIREAIKTEGLDPREILAGQEYLGRLEWAFVNIPFGIVAGFGVFAGWLDTVVLRRFLVGRGEKLVSLTGWNVPEWLIWFPILAGFATFFTEGVPRFIGMNLMVPAVVIYFLQGLAILESLFEAWSAPGLARGLIMGLIFIQLSVAGPMLALLGAFDQWIDFRRRLSPKKGDEARHDDRHHRE